MHELLKLIKRASQLVILWALFLLFIVVAFIWDAWNRFGIWLVIAGAVLLACVFAWRRYRGRHWYKL